MPLLMCPNCHSSMQAVSRSGVEFDMCPSCRGIWLDRGELEKILALDRGSVTHRGSHSGYERQHDDHRRDHDNDDHYRSRYGEHGYKKKKSSIFDVFD